MKEEIGRCEVLKLDSIGRVIGCVRQQMRDMQEKCCVSDEECRTFQPLEEGGQFYVCISAFSVQMAVHFFVTLVSFSRTSHSLVDVGDCADFFPI